MMKFSSRLKRAFVNCDCLIVIPTIVLCIIGVLMVYSASSTNLAYANASTTSYFKRQVIFDLVGLLIMFGILVLKENGLKKLWTNLLKFITIFLLIYVFHGSGQWRQSMDQLGNSQRPAFRGLQIYDGFVAFKGTG